MPYGIMRGSHQQWDYRCNRTFAHQDVKNPQKEMGCRHVWGMQVNKGACAQVDFVMPEG